MMMALDGKELRQAAGPDRLVVVVMKGTWCPVCLGQLRSFYNQRDRLEGLDTRVVGVAGDLPDSVTLEAAYWPILPDTDHSWLTDQGLWLGEQAMPSLLVYDKCGVQRLRIEGRSPGDQAEDRVFEVLESLTPEIEDCPVLS
jgi:peroxiredoxin